ASVCTAAILSCSCPLWVISGHSRRFLRCPLYPQKRTSRHTVGMSAMCHKRTCRPLRFWVDLLLNDYRQCERERRVAAKLRLDPDLTAVHLDDARRYRGPQAGPALLARDSIVATTP